MNFSGKVGGTDSQRSPSARTPWVTGSLHHHLEPEQLNSALTGFGFQSRWSEQELLLLRRNAGG